MNAMNQISKLRCWLLAATLLFLLPAASLAQTVTATIPVGSRPTAVALNPVTNKVYVAACPPTSPTVPSTNGTVTVIDGDTNTTTTVGAGVCPTAVAVNTVTNGERWALFLNL